MGWWQNYWPWPWDINNFLTEERYLKLCSFIIAVCLLCQGCAIIPWQISVALNTADIISASSSNKTLIEHGMSNITGKDCQWYRLLDGAEICMTKEEELEYLKEHKCKVSAWNILCLLYTSPSPRD